MTSSNSHPSSKRFASAALACAALLSAAGAVRAESATAVTFKSAVENGNSIRLMSVWPKKGAVKLFGDKYDYEKARSRAKFEDGVFKLLHWPKDGENGVAAEITETKQGRVMLYAVKPAGAVGPVCFLRSPKPGVPAMLVECREK